MKNFTFSIILIFAALIGSAQTATFEWIETEISDGNTLNGMTIFENSAVICGDENTFVMSVDGGTTWDTLNIFNPQFSLSAMSIKENVGFIISSREEIYKAKQNVYTNGLLLKTADRGDSWQLIEDPVMSTVDSCAVNPFATLCFGADYQTVITVNDSIAYCAIRWFEYDPSGQITHQGIFKTTNGGQNWLNISGDLSNTYIAAMASYGDTVLIGGNKVLYKTHTNIDTLTNIFAAMPGDGSDYVSDIDFVNENEIYISTIADSIYFSYDGANSFDKFGTIKYGNDVLKVNDTTIVVAAGKNKSQISFNNGQSWSNLDIPTSVWEVGGVFNDTLYMLTAGAIYKAALSDLEEGNINFIIQEVGSENIQKMFIANSTTALLVGNDDTFYKTTDSGLNWIKQSLPEIPALTNLLKEIDLNDISSINEISYVVSDRFKFVDYDSGDDIYYSGGVIYTEDNWSTSKLLDISKLGNGEASDPAKNPNHESCNGVATQLIKYIGQTTEGKDILLLWAQWFDYSSSEKATHSGIFKTTDSGKNWNMVSEDFGSLYMQDIVSKGDTVYIVGNKIFQRSIDMGETFTNMYPNLDIDEDDAMFIKTIVPVGDSELFIVTSTDSCHWSTDDGATFKTVGNIKGSNAFYSFDANSFIFLGSDGKSNFTNDGGETWQNCQPDAVIFNIGGIYDDKFYALARGSVYTNEIANFDLTTAIPTLYTKAELNVAYGSTSIDLISTDGEIERCSMYTISGKLVLQAEPNNSVFRLNNNQFQTGIYIVNSVVEGKRYVNKIAFR